MTASMVTRCEVYMDIDEQNMLIKVVNWIENMTEDELDAMPEGVQEMLNNIYEEIHDLLDLIPEEH